MTGGCVEVAPAVTMTGSPVTVTMTTSVTTSTCVSMICLTAGAAISKPFLTIGEAEANATQREAIAIEERILIDVDDKCQLISLLGCLEISE